MMAMPFTKNHGKKHQPKQEFMLKLATEFCKKKSPAPLPMALQLEVLRAWMGHCDHPCPG